MRIRSEDRGVLYDIASYFTFKTPGYFFMPAYRNGTWDGTIRLFNTRTQTMPRGLLHRLARFCMDRGHELDFSAVDSMEPRQEKLSVEEAELYLRSLNPTYKGAPLEPHKHQIDALSHTITHGRSVLLSPTSSGKSLVIYALARWHAEEKGRRVLIIVPNIGLVSQLAGDFLDYSSADGWADGNCQLIMEGKSKEIDNQVVISTWQSIYKLDRAWFRQFDAVIGDEAHHFKAKSLVEIMGKAERAFHRTATTGTLDGTQVHRLVIEGEFGPVHSVTTTKELMDNDIVSLLSIKAILLEHPQATIKAAKGLKYHEEMEFLCKSNRRTEFIVNLASGLKGNTLVLYQFVGMHGEELHRRIQEACPGRKVFFIHGDVVSEDRMTAREEMENSDDCIIVASYQTFATGISIRKLHNVVFASPFKSEIRLRQSIGRQLRKHPDKKKAMLFDIGDILCDDPRKAKVNYTLEHFRHRIDAYKSEGFDYTIGKVRLC